MQFDFDEKTGILKDKLSGERCVIITQARMQQIFSRLSEIFQSGAAVIISEAAKAAGERFAKETSNLIKADKEILVKTIIQRFTEAGLGKIEITELNLAENTVKFRIWNNFFAEIQHDGLTYCYCVEGFAAGMYEQIMHKSPKIEKTKCVGNGDPYCEWQIAPK
jgi:predicted hydrocarbon binding protein